MSEHPSDMLWSGLLLGSAYKIEQGLAKGADMSSTPRPEFLMTVPGRDYLTTYTLPIKALFEECKQWSSSMDHTHSQYKAACDRFIKDAPKEHFARNGGGTLLLSYAKIPADRQKFSIFQKVLRRTPKKDLQAVDAEGYSALDHYVRHGLMQNIKALIAAGLDPDACNKSGQNSLHHFATRFGNGGTTSHGVHWVHIVQVLLKAGATVRVDHDGNTPYHLNISLPLTSFMGSPWDVNTINNQGMSLAAVAAHQAPKNETRALSLIGELLDHPDTHWPTQLHDMEWFLDQLTPRFPGTESYKRAMKIIDAVIVKHQAQALEDSTPSPLGLRNKVRL